MKKCEWPVCLDAKQARDLCSDLLALELGDQIDNRGLVLVCAEKCNLDLETGTIPDD